MDLRMPRLSGAGAARAILHHLPRTPILFVSGYSEPLDVLDALNAGTSGYLVKTCSLSELLAAIYLVRDGHSVYDASLTRLVLDRLPDVGDDEDAPSDLRLTDREKEIHRLIADGRSETDIAEQLAVAPPTVDRHVRNITAKFQARTQRALARYATEKGFDQLPG